MVRWTNGKGGGEESGMLVDTAGGGLAGGQSCSGNPSTTTRRYVVTLVTYRNFLKLICFSSLKLIIFLAKENYILYYRTCVTLGVEHN